ncbi:hypothetical protein FO519_009824, partial [Halicephalobus sp. NKZ332]
MFSCIPKSKNNQTDVVPVFGENTENATSFDSLDSTLVRGNEYNDILQIKSKYQIKNMIKKNQKCEIFLKELGIDPRMAINLWKNNESYFKEMVEFYSKFQPETTFFLIQIIKGKVILPKKKMNSENIYPIKEIDYGHQVVIALPDYINQKGLIKEKTLMRQEFYKGRRLINAIQN